MNVNAGTIGIELTASTAQFRQDIASAQNTVSGFGAVMQRAAAVASTSFSDISQAIHTTALSAKDYINASQGIIDVDAKVSYANKKLADSLTDQIRAMTMSRSEMTLYKTSLAGTSTEVQELGRRLAQLQGAQDTFAQGATKGAHASGQFSLASAGSTRELLVLGHEMSQGNFSRFGGSLLVLAERSNAMSLIFSAAGAATMVLVGALGLLAFAAIKGHMESAELNKQMQLTGNYAGMTAGQFDSLALKIGESTHMGIGFARDVTASLAASGSMNAKTLAIASEAAGNFARLSGKSAEDVGADFSKMSAGVTLWAETHNQSYHFLTGDQYLYIATLEKEGHTQEAMQATMEAFNEHAKKNVASLTELQSAWAATRYSLSEFWDMLKGIGRDATIEDKVRAAAQALKDAQKTLAVSGGAGQDSDNARKLKVTIAQAEANLKVLQTQKDLQESDKADLALQAKFSEASVNAQKAVATLRLSLMDRQQQGEEAVKQYELGQRAIMAAGDKAYDNEAAHIKMVADIRAQYASPDTIDKADTYRLEAMLRHAQRETAATVQHLDDLAKLDDLYHKAGELSDGQFYENKRVHADARASAEIQGFDAQLKALVDHDNSTEAEEERTQKAISDIWDKRIDAIRKAAAAKELADQEERLRQKKIISDSDDAMNKYLSSLHKELETLNLANEGHEKSKTAVEAEAVAVLDNAIAYQQAFIAQQASNGATEAELAQAPKILEFLKTQRDLRAQISTALATKDVDTANRKAAEAASEAWKRAAKTIEDDLTTAILDGGGKGWKKLVKDMEFAFARMVLQPVLAPIAGGIASFLNPGAPQANGGALAGTSALINQASAANSLYNLYNTGLAGSIGGGISALGGFTGSTTLSAFGSGMSGVAGGTYAGMGATVAGSETGLGALVGSEAAGAGTSVATAIGMIPGWGWAALGAAAIGAYLLNSGGPIDNTRLQFTSNNTPGNISINERGNEGKSDSYINGFGTSALGTFGINSTYWMNAGQPAVQDFIKTVSQTDDVLASFMTTAEKASVSSFLTGKTSTANTGSEDANPNANGQLDKVFAERINNILEGVQPGLSSLTAGFTGTSQALATEAGALLQYRAALKDSGEAVFGTKATLQEIAALKLPTELTSAALARVTNEFEITNQVAQLLGKDSASAFGAVGLSSEAARRQLIQFAGGATALAQQTASFSQNYFTDAERLVPVTKAVDAAMASLGLSAITTREQFKEVARGLDLSTAAGAKQFADMMALQEAFAQVHPAIEATTGAINDLAGAAKSAAEIASESASIQKQIFDLTHTAAEIQNRDRADELAALDAANRPQQEYLNSLKDQAAAVQAAATALATAAQVAQQAADNAMTRADNALSALSRSVAAEKAANQTAYDTQVKAINDRLALDKKTAQDQVQTASTVASTLHGIYSSLQSAAQASYVMSRGNAQEILRNALAVSNAGGSLANFAGLDQALQAVAQPSELLFHTFQEYQRDQALTSNNIKALALNAGNQATVADMTLEAMNKTVAAVDASAAAQLGALANLHADDVAQLDGVLATGQAQLDALKGIDNTLLSIPNAISALGEAIAQAGAARQAAIQASANAAAANPAADAAPLTVSGLYQKVLGRAPEQAGLDFWTKAFGASVDASEVQQFLQGAQPELAAKAAGTWDQFLQAHNVPGFAAGTSYVPNDMLAQIHAGEAIVPAADNRELLGRLKAPANSNAELVSEIRALRTTMECQQASLERIDRSTKKEADQFERVTRGGEGMLISADSEIPVSVIL